MKKITRPHRSPIWEDMKPPALRKLALAVALIFAALGPIQVLMLPVLPDDIWYRVLALTLLSSGFAASIILFGKRLLFLLITIAVFLALIFSLPASFHLVLEEQKPPGTAADGTTILSKEQIEEQGNLRLLIGMSGIMMIAAGYAVFIFVINKEVQRCARLESEMNMAQNIQRSLLPVAPLQLAWCEIAGMCVPAAEVGGDYFDVISLSEEEVLVVIGDVSGHGLGAGILAAMTKSALYSHFDLAGSPGNVLMRLNSTLCRLTSKNSFVTLAGVYLNQRTRTVRLATAGHPPVLHYQAASQTIAARRTPSLGLGMAKDAVFEELEIPLVPGDRFLLYTDGVIEAGNRAAEQFGEERLRETTFAQRHASAGNAGAAVIAAVKNFSQQKSLGDDATVVWVRVT